MTVDECQDTITKKKTMKATTTTKTNTPATSRAATPAPTPSNKILAQCLTLLKGGSDEHKFAGLVMVTKHVPALAADNTTSDSTGCAGGSGATGAREESRGQLRQICDAVGTAFVHRLLKTARDSSGEGLSVYQHIALGVLSAFLQDETLVARFVPVAPALVRTFRAASMAETETQAVCDALMCAQALADAPGAMERLLRAGAASAIVGRLVAASRARTLVSADVPTDGGKVDGNTVNVGGSRIGIRDTGKNQGGGGTKTSSRAEGNREENGHQEGCSKLAEEEPAAAAVVAKRAEALAFAFVGRALEASSGQCLGQRELTAVAEAFRDEPTAAKFAFMNLLLRWASLQEGEGTTLVLLREGGNDSGGTPLNSGGGGRQADGGASAGPMTSSTLGSWTRRGAFPAALREGLLQAMHGAADDKRRDSALALLASLLRSMGQEWAVEDGVNGAPSQEETGTGIGGTRSRGEASSGGSDSNTDRPTRSRKRGTFVSFVVRCAAGEVRILLDESLSLLLPKTSSSSSLSSSAARGQASGSPAKVDAEIKGKARGPMAPAGIDPSIGIAAEMTAAKAAAAGGSVEETKNQKAATANGSRGAPLPPHKPLSARERKAIKDGRIARLSRMLPVGLGVVESTIAFLCGGGGGGGGEEESDEEDREGSGGVEAGSVRWEELPIDTLQDLQKTLVGLFGCVLDFMSELRPWVIPSTRAAAKTTTAATAAASPSLVDLWTLRRLGLNCSRALGMWMAEDPESLPQRFLEALPTLLALNTRPEPPDSDDEDSDDEREQDIASFLSSSSLTSSAAALRAFPGAAGQLALSFVDGSDGTGGSDDNGDGKLSNSFQQLRFQQHVVREEVGARGSVAIAVDEAFHNILRAMLALSYEPAPLAAMVEEGVTARVTHLAAVGVPAIAAFLTLFVDAVPPAPVLATSTASASPSPSLPPEFAEQAAESLRSPLITACSLLTNILTSAGHLAWPERDGNDPPRGAAATLAWGAAVRPPPHAVLAHPEIGECLASLAEIAGLSGAARRGPARGGARWRLLAAHATLVVMTVARASSPENGLAPARGLADRKMRWGDSSAGGDATAVDDQKRGKKDRSVHNGGGSGGSGTETVWAAMVRAVDEALGSLSMVPGQGLVGGRRCEDEEASYEEGAIWQWCLECARAIEASPGGAAGNAFVARGVLPRRVLKILAEASSDGRI